jgi:SAM-dependent methyltransferase
MSFSGFWLYDTVGFRNDGVNAVRMNLFYMKGSYDPTTSRLYNWVVVPALEELYREQSGSFLEGALERSGARVLDVGCGPGHAVAIMARQYPELELTGVDLSEEMIAEAKRRNAGVSNLSFRQGDAMALPFEDNSFDHVTSMASIKHWPDQRQGLSEIRRVLTPGGTALVMEADRNCSWRAAHNFVLRWRGVFPPGRPLITYWFRRFVAGQGMSAGQLERLFADAGFVQPELTAMEDYPAVVARGVKATER